MEIKEITKLMNMAEDKQEIAEAREELEALVLQKNETSRKQSGLQKQLDALYSEAIKSGEEDPELYSRIQSVKAEMDVAEQTPSKIDEEIEKQKGKIRRLEWEHHQRVREAAPEAVKPVVERYLEIMTEARELEQELERAEKAVREASPEFDKHDRLKAAMLKGVGVSKPITVTDKRIESFERGAEKRGII